MNRVGRKAIIIIFYCSSVLLFFQGCKTRKKGNALFRSVPASSSGIDFNNELTYNKEFNLFDYMYFYNGSGVGAGDFNNDKLVDIFFAANQLPNRLYQNKGNLKFTDITQQAKIPADSSWSTGVSVVDINNDGWLDIYVCRVGNYEKLHSKNQLLINQGIDKNGVPSFIDKAKEYGLDFSGFSTQSAFLDYDNDGDLDMFLLNHSVHENGSYRPRSEFISTYSQLSGDKIFRNDGDHFIDVTKETGINSSSIGYGLGISIADFNLDGYPDIYIGNDFHENDYLYINQKNGTFREEAEAGLRHTSQYTMGVDAADVNNDAFPEIISMDMLPEDPYILKRSLGEDSYDIFSFKINAGYSHQYSRNNFQFNRGNGLFSEIGMYSGIYGTDWSWAPLWMDFDNDGLKDLFISNGIPKRLNDIDYINFVSNGGETQEKIRLNNTGQHDLSLIDKFPQIKLPNKFYRNSGDMSFADMADGIEDNPATFSNGAIYADLDNDGDLDIIANNINSTALLYENTQNLADSGRRSSLSISLKGPAGNVNAIGAKLFVFAKDKIQSYDKSPVHGFLSSMEIPLLIGTRNIDIDSMVLVWPDRTFQRLDPKTTKAGMMVEYKPGLPVFDYGLLNSLNKNGSNFVTDISSETGLNYLHEENHFNEFDREPLMPHMLSTEGPGVAIADIDHNGLEDVFIGGARGKKAAVFMQLTAGRFSRMAEPTLDADSIQEDVAATWVDVNNDTDPDLLVASGGNEFFGTDSHNSPRLYLNDGKGNLGKSPDAFTDISVTASCIISNDFNADGFQDLFVGGRAVAFEYGQIPRSYLLLNDGKGKFSDVTAKWSAELSQIGFVTDARWADINGDRQDDLLISLEWGGIVSFIKQKDKLLAQPLTTRKGWWNSILPYDIDNDGDIDLIAGNLGLNTRLKASVEKPVRMYYNDFDGNGKREQVMTYYLSNKEIPFASKADLERQLPGLKKKFLYAQDFANASLNDLFGAEKLEAATVYSADYFSNAILINNGKGQFETIAVPWQAQLTSMRDAVIVDANNDSLPDILLVGNYYANPIAIGQYDADYGTLLINKGKGGFTSSPLNGYAIRGQIRHARQLLLGNQKTVLLARNDDSVVILKFDSSTK